MYFIPVVIFTLFFTWRGGTRRAMGAGKKQRPASKLAAAQRRVDATRGGGRPAVAAAAAATGLQQKCSAWRVMYTHNRPGWSEINTVEGE